MLCCGLLLHRANSASQKGLGTVAQAWSRMDVHSFSCKVETFQDVNGVIYAMKSIVKLVVSGNDLHSRHIALLIACNKFQVGLHPLEEVSQR